MSSPNAVEGQKQRHRLRQQSNQCAPPNAVQPRVVTRERRHNMDETELRLCVYDPVSGLLHFGGVEQTLLRAPVCSCMMAQISDISRVAAAVVGE